MNAIWEARFAVLRTCITLHQLVEWMIDQKFAPRTTAFVVLVAALIVRLGMKVITIIDNPRVMHPVTGRCIFY